MKGLFVNFVANNMVKGAAVSQHMAAVLTRATGTDWSASARRQTFPDDEKAAPKIIQAQLVKGPRVLIPFI
jgi:hypothetical protein